MYESEDSSLPLSPLWHSPPTSLLLSFSRENGSDPRRLSADPGESSTPWRTTVNPRRDPTFAVTQSPRSELSRRRTKLLFPNDDQAHGEPVGDDPCSQRLRPDRLPIDPDQTLPKRRLRRLSLRSGGEGEATTLSLSPLSLLLLHRGRQLSWAPARSPSRANGPRTGHLDYQEEEGGYDEEHLTLALLSLPFICEKRPPASRGRR